MARYKMAIKGIISNKKKVSIYMCRLLFNLAYFIIELYSL